MKAPCADAYWNNHDGLGLLDISVGFYPKGFIALLSQFQKIRSARESLIIRRRYEDGLPLLQPRPDLFGPQFGCSRPRPIMLRCNCLLIPLSLSGVLIVARRYAKVGILYLDAPRAIRH